MHIVNMGAKLLYRITIEAYTILLCLTFQHCQMTRTGYNLGWLTLRSGFFSIRFVVVLSLSLLSSDFSLVRAHFKAMSHLFRGEVCFIHIYFEMYSYRFCWIWS